MNRHHDGEATVVVRRAGARCDVSRGVSGRSLSTPSEYTWCMLYQTQGWHACRKGRDVPMGYRLSAHVPYVHGKRTCGADLLWQAEWRACHL